MLNILISFMSLQKLHNLSYIYCHGHLHTTKGLSEEYSIIEEFLCLVTVSLSISRIVITPNDFNAIVLNSHFKPKISSSDFVILFGILFKTVQIYACYSNYSYFFILAAALFLTSTST